MAKKRFVVLIPARGGSKGLPNKNILPIDDKPLICYTIDAARGLFSDDDIYVSTDSSRIRKVVEDYGLPISGLRPKHLSTDSATTAELILNFIENLESNLPEYIILLQPTSPLRTSIHILEAINLVKDDVDMVVSVTMSHANPYWNIFEENNEGFLVKSKPSSYTRRQDIPPVYVYNGAIYIISVSSMLKNKTLEFKKIVKYVMDKKFSIDIDDISDFKLARILIDEKN